MEPRSSVKALIMHKGKLLTIQKGEGDGTVYLLPGGGQHYGETFHEALQRECLEELGVEVNIHDLLYVREYMSKNHENAASEEDTHTIDHIFSCSLTDPGIEFHPKDPDDGQVDVKWMALDILENSRFYPKSLIKDMLAEYPALKTCFYLGEVN